jgi:hypothetical protein
MAMYIRRVRPAALGLAALVLFASPVGAGQSDRSLDEAYARDCPNNKKSQLCDMLRGAIRTAGATTTDDAKAAEAPGADARWGVLAAFAERDYQGPNSQTVTFRWEVPGETMAVVFWSPLVSPTYRFRLDAASGAMELESPGQWKRQRTPVRMSENGELHLEGLPYSKPYVSRSGSGNPVFLGAELTPAMPGSRGAKKVASLVAAGKVRAAGLTPAAGSAAAPPTAALAAVPAPAADRPATRSAIAGLFGSMLGAVAKAPASLLGARAAEPTPAPATTAPGAPVSLAGLESYVGKTYLDVPKTGEQALIRTRWIEPGKVYEWTREGRFSPTSTIRWTVSPDGSLAGEAASGTRPTGSLDAAGLPATIAERDGKEWLSSMLSTPGGLFVISSENRAKKGKPAKWKERSRYQRRVIDDVEANLVSRQWAEARRNRWGALAMLAGKDWYCTQYEPTHWTTRTIRFHTQFGRSTNRSLPTMRLTSARWIEPYSVLEIGNTLGSGQKWTDRISLASDGNFDMVSEGVSTWNRMRGVPDAQGNIAFNMGTLTFMGSSSPINIEFTSYANSPTPITQMTGTYAGPACVLEPYDNAKLAEWQQRLDGERRSVAESMQWDNEYWQDAARSYAEGQQMLANMRGDLFREVFVGIPQAIADVNQRKAELNVLRQAAEQETAMRRAAEERAERDRIAAENARRVEAANARQEAIAQQNAQRRADDQAQASAAEAQADAERARRAEVQRAAAEETARREAEERRATADAERQKREAQAAADAERRRQAEAARLAELRRKEEEARRPVAFREGVVVCEKKRENYYRCDGPLQVTYSDLVSPAGLTSLGEACGARSTRDLGMSGGYRIFGCGFGIHPTNRDYPGNRDTPAMYGLYINDRATFYCPKSTDAYCRGR